MLKTKNKTGYKTRLLSTLVRAVRREVGKPSQNYEITFTYGDLRLIKWNWMSASVSLPRVMVPTTDVLGMLYPAAFINRHGVLPASSPPPEVWTKVCDKYGYTLLDYGKPSKREMQTKRYERYKKMLARWEKRLILLERKKVSAKKKITKIKKRILYYERILKKEGGDV